LEALVDVDELTASEVWLVRTSSNVDTNQLHESSLHSAPGLSVDAKKKAETLTIVGADRKRAGKEI